MVDQTNSAECWNCKSAYILETHEDPEVKSLKCKKDLPMLSDSPCSEYKIINADTTLVTKGKCLFHYEKIDPPHYTRLSPEPKDVMRQWDLNCNLGPVIKYIARAGHKEGSLAIDDLKKAIRYIEFEIEYLEHEYDEAIDGSKNK
jgi:hypothetical protein